MCARIRARWVENAIYLHDVVFYDVFVPRRVNTRARGKTRHRGAVVCKFEGCLFRTGFGDRFRDVFRGSDGNCIHNTFSSCNGICERVKAPSRTGSPDVDSALFA